MSALRFNGTTSYLRTPSPVLLSGLVPDGQQVYQRLIFQSHSHPAYRSYISYTFKFTVYHGLQPYYPVDFLVIGAYTGSITWFFPLGPIELDKTYCLDTFYRYISSSDTGVVAIYLNGVGKFFYTIPSPNNQLAEIPANITFGARGNLTYFWNGTIQWFEHSMFSPREQTWYQINQATTYPNDYRLGYPTVVSADHAYDFGDMTTVVPDKGAERNSSYDLVPNDVEVVASLFEPDSLPYIATYGTQVRVKRKLL